MEWTVRYPVGDFNIVAECREPMWSLFEHIQYSGAAEVASPEAINIDKHSTKSHGFRSVLVLQGEEQENVIFCEWFTLPRKDVLEFC